MCATLKFRSLHYELEVTDAHVEQKYIVTIWEELGYFKQHKQTKKSNSSSKKD